MQATLSHYRVLEEIGKGGMGVVYRAHDERLDRNVALKVLPSGVLADESARKRFRKEALALSKLNHPNIATVFDFDTQDETDFLVEELIEGVSLDEILASGPLPEREIVNLGTQLCDGLAAAHEHDVIHRDLKPANVRVTPDARLKILDFGLAKMMHRVGPIEATASLTETQAVSGTLPYMAPEQLLSEKLDARTDIWGAGCVLYEMAAGRRPFLGSGPALTDAILHQAPALPSKLNHKVAPGLDVVILKCLEKDPSLRYSSARDIAVDLHRMTSASSMIRVLPQRPRLGVRNIVIALALVAVLALAALVVWRLGLRTAGTRVAQPPQVTPSIAVLPFVNMSSDRDQEYFADGLSEELLNSLAKIPDLRVVARTSSFQFKNKNVKLADIGRELNAATILEGSVRKQSNRVRITAQLVNAADGYHLWSETYDRELTDIFAIQAEIAGAVATSLKGVLGPAASSAQATMPEAYSDLLLGRSYLRLSGEQNVNKARTYFEQGLKVDPNYAPLWVGLAMAAMNSSVYSGDVHEAYRRAREAAEHALTLDPNLAMAHIAVGRVKRDYDWDWFGADASYQRALALEPGNALAIHSAASMAMTLGRVDQGLTLSRQTLTLDPLSAQTHHSHAHFAWSAGLLEEAATETRKALEINPEYPWAHSLLGILYLAKSRPKEALAEMQQESLPGFRLQGLALAYHALGQNQESDTALNELIAIRQVDMSFQIAEVYAFRGQTDSAFLWLERAYLQRDGGLTWIKTDPFLKVLGRDPRYPSFLRKMRLPLD